MKNKQAFTLIELLVVVLIIGILAAVAVPQYQRAVEKSRGAQALAVINSIENALIVYYMANSSFPQSFDELSVDMDSWTGTEKWCNITSSSYGVIDTRSNGDWSIQMYKTSAGNLYLFIGRLTGKYQGTGFAKKITANSGSSLSETPMWCAERFRDGVTFSESAGSYCKKIWKTSEYDPAIGTTWRSYAMQY